MLAGEYTFGVKLKSSLNYRLKSNIQLDMNYTGYEKVKRLFHIHLFSNKVYLLLYPFRLAISHHNSRLSVDQIFYTAYKTTNASFLFSGNFNGISSNVTTSAVMYDAKHISTSSNFSFSFRLPGQINLMPSAQYDYNKKKLMSVNCNLQKPLMRMVSEYFIPTQFNSKNE